METCTGPHFLIPPAPCLPDEVVGVVEIGMMGEWLGDAAALAANRGTTSSQAGWMSDEIPTEGDIKQKFHILGR